MFLENLFANVYTVGEPLANILQKLVIDGIKDKLQPLVAEGKIISIDSNGFIKGSCTSLKEIIDSQGYIFEHFKIKIETPPNVVIEKEILLPTILQWLPKDGYEEHIFGYCKTTLKTRSRYFIEIYNLLIPSTLIQPIYDKLSLHCTCPSYELLPVHTKIWAWWIEFGCKICGKTYFCECFRPARKVKKVAIEQSRYYSDAGWPQKFLSALKRSEFRPKICHLCTDTKSELTFVTPCMAVALWSIMVLM